LNFWVSSRRNHQKAYCQARKITNRRTEKANQGVNYAVAALLNIRLEDTGKREMYREVQESTNMVYMAANFQKC